MDDDASDISPIMDARASELLGVPIQSESTVQNYGDPNPFLQALEEPIPDDIYRPKLVFTVVDGQVRFAPWVFVFATPISINIYERLFNERNTRKGGGGISFPKKEFMAQRRRMKNNIYQRKHRHKKRSQQRAS